MLGGLVLGGERLLATVQRQLVGKAAADETRWVRQQQQPTVRKRLQRILEGETDERIRLWARVRLGGERNVEVARELGYRGGSGVGQLVRRVEQRSVQDAQLRKKLMRIKANLSRVES